MNYDVNFCSLSPSFQKGDVFSRTKPDEVVKTSKKSKFLTCALTGLAVIASAYFLKRGFKKPPKIVDIKKPVGQAVAKNIAASSKSEVNNLLKQYVKKNRGKNGINPEELDKILTEGSKRNGVKERIFNPRPDMPQGRIKQYELQDGTRYVLETHSTNDGKVVTRLYEETSTVIDSFGNYKNQRKYLCKDGKFKTNAYASEEAHLITSESGKEWMQAA